METKKPAMPPVPEAYHNSLWNTAARNYLSENYPLEQTKLEISNTYAHFIGYACELAVCVNSDEYGVHGDLMKAKETAIRAMFNLIDREAETFCVSQLA